MSYKDGVLSISDGTNKMHFTCSDEFAGKILDAVKKAVQHPLESSGRHRDENVRNDRDAVIDSLLRNDYVEVGYTDNIRLFVGYPGLKLPDGYLIIFTYVSDSLPNRNGSIQINIPMNI